MPVSDRLLLQTVQAVREQCSASASIGIVLGSGLGNFVDAMQIVSTLCYRDLPHFTCSTAPGHAGRLIYGTINSQPVFVLQGRCHLYEGYNVDEVTYPIRLLAALGVKTLILSCAAGGLEKGLRVGDILLIEEQVNLQFARVMPSELTPQYRFVLYDEPYLNRLHALLGRLDFPGRRGTYVAVSGPNYETRAEQRFLRMFGTAVGMSTVVEAAVAQELRMRVCGLATITNLCNPDHPELTDGDHVVQAAAQAEPRFRQLVLEFLRELAAQNDTLNGNS